MFVQHEKSPSPHTRHVTTTCARHALVLLLALCVGGAGCGAFGEEEEECLFRAGTYRVEAVDAGGDCPTSFVDSITGVADSEEEEVACGAFVQTDAAAGANGCTATTELTGRYVNNGAEDVVGTVRLSCPGSLAANNCTHKFNYYVTKR